MKKKLTLLLSLLAFCVSGWAQVTSITDGGSYVIRFKKNSNFVSPSMNTTKVSAGRFRFDKVGTEGSYDVYNIYSINGSGYLNRTAAPANEGTTTITSSLEDTDNFKWTVATTVNSGNSDASVWTISPKGYATSATKFVLTGWTDTFKESNVLKFFNSPSHDLAQFKIAKYVDALNELSATACYNITNPRGWWDVANGASVINSTDETSLAFSYSDAKQQFAFIQYDSKYYLYSVSAQKFAYVDGTKLSLTPYFTSAVASSNVTFQSSTYSNASQYPVVITVGGKNFGISTGFSPDVYQYTSTNDQGNGSLIVEAGSFNDATAQAQITNTVSLTYNVYYGGSKVDEISTYGLVGDALSLPSTIYCTYTYYSSYSDGVFSSEITTVPAGGGTVYVKAEWAGPFDFSTDYENATWYYLTLHGQYFASNGADANPTLSAELISGDAGQWAFIGTPYNVQIINKALEGYYLQNTASKPTMTTTASNWEVRQNSDKFLLWNSTRNYIDGYNNSLGYYGSVDGNQNFTATLVPANYFSYVTANVTPFFTSGSDYFYLDSGKSGYSAVKAIYDEAVSTETCSEANYSTLVSYIETIDNYILPPTGYYRLKNYKYREDNYYMNAETASPNGITSNTTAGTIVYLTKADNTYTMQMQGNYLQTPASGTQVTLSSSPVTFTPSVGKAGWASFNAGGGARGNLHMDSYKKIVGWNANGIATNDASYWEVEDADDATITLNNGGDGNYYATLYLPFDATISDAEPYTLAKSGNYLVPTFVINAEVPAGTPVLLKSDKASATATINTGAAFNSGSPLSCALTGTFVDMSVTLTDGLSNDYFLGKKDSKVGFYKWDGTTLGANRAYLTKATAEAAVKGFILMFDDDDATGINTINGSELMVNGPIYNLAGQRLNKMQKGINIVNGKKVLK